MNVMAEVEDTRRLAAFRSEAQAWIKANFPESLKSKLEEYYQNMPRYPDGPDWALWKQQCPGLATAEGGRRGTRR